MTQRLQEVYLAESLRALVVCCMEKKHPQPNYEETLKLFLTQHFDHVQKNCKLFFTSVFSSSTPDSQPPSPHSLPPTSNPSHFATSTTPPNFDNWSLLYLQSLYEIEKKVSSLASSLVPIAKVEQWWEENAQRYRQIRTPLSPEIIQLFALLYLELNRPDEAKSKLEQWLYAPCQEDPRVTCDLNPELLYHYRQEEDRLEQVLELYLLDVLVETNSVSLLQHILKEKGWPQFKLSVKVLQKLRDKLQSLTASKQSSGKERPPKSPQESLDPDKNAPVGLVRQSSDSQLQRPIQRPQRLWEWISSHQPPWLYVVAVAMVIAATASSYHSIRRRPGEGKSWVHWNVWTAQARMLARMLGIG